MRLWANIIAWNRFALRFWLALAIGICSLVSSFHNQPSVSSLGRSIKHRCLRMNIFHSFTRSSCAAKSFMRPKNWALCIFTCYLCSDSVCWFILSSTLIERKTSKPNFSTKVKPWSQNYIGYAGSNFGSWVGYFGRPQTLFPGVKLPAANCEEPPE